MLKDPKLAILLAVHAGAIALMVDHGEGGFAPSQAVKRSVDAMEDLMGASLLITRDAIEAEFVNSRVAIQHTKEVT